MNGKVEIPFGLRAQFEDLVAAYAQKNDETIEESRRLVEIAILQSGVQEMRRRLTVACETTATLVAKCTATKAKS